jgi:polyisoprenyl-phosphate glycosyltransferase
MQNNDVIVLVPVFEDLEASTMLLAELARALGDKVHVVAVDDGSVRQPLDTSGICAAGLRGTVLRLRRNVGHQRAIATGLGFIAARFPHARQVVVMDSDGEDVPATIPALLTALCKPDVDVVVARRRSRVESFRFKTFYVVYKWLFALLTGRSLNFGNFMVLNNTALHRLASMGELATHVAGTVLLSRLRWTTCPIDRGPRYAGTSKMNFVGLALHGFRGLMVFAEDVLVRVGAACALVAALSLGASATAILLKSIGYATPGWFSVALGILLLVFLQTGAITLMTLMLTGVMRGSAVLPVDYRLLVDQVLEAERVAEPA